MGVYPPEDLPEDLPEDQLTGWEYALARRLFEKYLFLFFSRPAMFVWLDFTPC